MLGDLMNRIEGAKLEIRERLKDLVISKQDANAWVIVKVNGQRQVLDMEISEDLLAKGEPELISDIVTNVINDALSEAEIREKELMEEVAKDIMPAGMGGLKGLFG